VKPALAGSCHRPQWRRILDHSLLRGLDAGDDLHLEAGLAICEFCLSSANFSAPPCSQLFGAGERRGARRALAKHLGQFQGHNTYLSNTPTTAQRRMIDDLQKDDLRAGFAGKKSAPFARPAAKSCM